MRCGSEFGGFRVARACLSNREFFALGSPKLLHEDDADSDNLSSKRVTRESPEIGSLKSAALVEASPAGDSGESGVSGLKGSGSLMSFGFCGADDSVEIMCLEISESDGNACGDFRNFCD